MFRYVVDVSTHSTELRVKIPGFLSQSTLEKKIIIFHRNDQNGKREDFKFYTMQVCSCGALRKGVKYVHADTQSPSHEIQQK